MMTTPDSEAEEPEQAASGPADAIKLPVVKATQIVNEIVDQAPLYGLSGAILAVGLVTGRRALARTGASMLTSQLITALARAATDRVLPAQAGAGEKAVREESTSHEASPPADGPSTSRIAAGAVLGVAAAAAGGWLLNRLLAKRSADEDAAEAETEN
jgi:hypothetical protein